MKAIAINSSSNMDKGNTALVLGPFLEGMKEAGAEVELFYTKKLKIGPCQGEFDCWVKTPGRCFQQDDMQMLLPKTAETDVRVLATPFYVDGMSGPMKNMLDRIIPLAHPRFELRDGHCRHPVREGVRAGRLVLVANCGFWEMDNFNPLLVHIEAVCRNLTSKFAGALLRPHGPALKVMMEIGLPVDDVLAAAKAAGRQLMESDKIPPEILKVVSRELVPLEMYVRLVNGSVRKTLGALERQ